MTEEKQNYNNIVFIDGITRAGKFWLANMLIHFDRTEHMQQHPIMEVCSYMNQLRLLTDEVAVRLLEIGVSHHSYEMTIGRNINFKMSDSSSIYNNPNLQTYLQRISASSAKNRDIEKEIENSKRLFLFIVHNALGNGRICFKAFPKLKFIRMERNPIDLVYAWYKRVEVSVKTNVICIRPKGKKELIPWFAHDWFKEYQAFSEVDRTIKSINSLSQMAKQSVKDLPDTFKKRVIFTSYELLATQPKIEAQKLSAFLGTKPSTSMELFLAQDSFKQRNKETIKKLRQQKLLEIKKEASAELFSLLMELNSQYSASSFDI